MNFIEKVMIPIGLPLVSAYCSAREDVFLNTYDKEAKGLEAVGNWLLTPARYLLGGREITQLNLQDKSCEIAKEFTANDNTIAGILKTAFAIVNLLPTLLIGSILKGVTYLSEDARAKHQLIESCQKKLGDSSVVEKK